MNTKARRPRRPGSVRRGRWRGNQLVLVAVALVALPVVAWLAIRAADRNDPTPPGARADDPGVSHVHGLGINPSDGSLIVATHYGSFRIPHDGGAKRIGDSFQDTMGFTVAGPNRFLGSGHPDREGVRKGLPSRLGLIESDDGGVSWTNLSLGGEVDFHGLAYAHNQVYGWDSGTGRFMVSADRTDWQTRSTVRLLGFAVDPANADHIVAATPDGPISSTDGGRTWKPGGGPQLLVLSWSSDGGLWGTDPGGTVWRLAGDQWERSGRLPGEPQALLGTPGALYAAAHGDGDVTAIYRSIDEGRTWQIRYRDDRS